jgi:histidine triad (HIT) family protein
MSSCIFCRIVAREIPGDIVHETDHVLAFRDLRPVAPTHVLVIPKRHVESVRESADTDAELLGHVMLGARDVAQKLGVAAKGYRVVLNNGEDGGQTVFHLHAHVLAGRGLSWPPG